MERGRSRKISSTYGVLPSILWALITGIFGSMPYNAKFGLGGSIMGRRRGAKVAPLLWLGVFVFFLGSAFFGNVFGYSVSGSVLDEYGQPIVGVAVQLDKVGSSANVIKLYFPSQKDGGNSVDVSLGDGTWLKPYTYRNSFNDLIMGFWDVDAHPVTCAGYSPPGICSPRPGKWWFGGYEGLLGDHIIYYQNCYTVRSASGSFQTYYSHETYTLSRISTGDAQGCYVNFTIGYLYNITWRTSTNANGFYSFSADDGDYFVSASRANYTSCSANPVRITISGNNATVDFCLTNVTNQPPTSIAVASPSSALVGDSISFSSTGSYDPDGRIVSYRWEFGDGAAEKVAHEIEKAEEELAKAYEELAKGNPDNAIKKFEKAWLHAQEAIKHGGRK